ncbi:hypothetical protein ADK52_25430 [Streptomyces sp. WM6372]|uniref:hypothetical protein n=1 Tax=Streptomyces sp. WM6372 TaxID=1415555 RepID=UPI0006AF4265|nr:hypothetical protein [Streptomyces sp. WM6372]KOU20934.1 hypothetical protein ADK52_25430 [Streptomyces sp. WM6372]
MARICRHTLKLTFRMPQWLSCDTCHADFPHRADCPGHGTAACAASCMNDPERAAEIATLEAAFALPCQPTA